MSNTGKKQNVKKNKSVKKSNNRIGFLLFSVVIFLVILVSTVFNDVVQIYNNKKNTKELKEKYVELLEEEDSLNNEVIKLQDPEYVDRYAREKYLYTLDGEKILMIINDEEDKNNSDES